MKLKCIGFVLIFLLSILKGRQINFISYLRDRYDSNLVKPSNNFIPRLNLRFRCNYCFARFLCMLHLSKFWMCIHTSTCIILTLMIISNQWTFWNLRICINNVLYFLYSNLLQFQHTKIFIIIIQGILTIWFYLNLTVQKLSLLYFTKASLCGITYLNI